MKRVFGEEDRKKKEARITAKASTRADASGSDAAQLNDAVRAALKDGYLACPTAFAIARRLKVPLQRVGDAADALGFRVSDCQLGCFRVEKTAWDGQERGPADRVIVAQIEALLVKGPLTCSAAFGIARRMKVRPADVGEAANRSRIKIRECQLGCF